jgi:hypothetical protein
MMHAAGDPAGTMRAPVLAVKGTTYFRYPGVGLPCAKDGGASASTWHKAAASRRAAELLRSADESRCQGFPWHRLLAMALVEWFVRLLRGG